MNVVLFVIFTNKIFGSFVKLDRLSRNELIDNSEELFMKIASLPREKNDLNFLYSEKNSQNKNFYLFEKAMNRLKFRENFIKQVEPNFRSGKNCYLIKFHNDIDRKRIQKLLDLFKAIDLNIDSLYDAISASKICFSDGELPLKLLHSISFIEFVERESIISGFQIQKDAPWGLAHISKPSDGKSYHFNRTGKGVNVYVIDSGVDPDHEEFAGRAVMGCKLLNEDNDCSGHGTEVSSIIAGTNVGVAKQANIIVIQVLDCTGQGQNSDLLSAIDWIIKNFKPPGLINMSIGGPKSPVVDEAVNHAISLGIPVVVAAGNSNSDACLSSPSGVKLAVVVGAINSKNQRASFSNYGECVNIFAPGEHILVASSEGNKKGMFDWASGTSLAAPFVSGVLALYLEENPDLKPEQLKMKMDQDASKGILFSENLFSSPNSCIRGLICNDSSSNEILVELLPAGSLPGSEQLATPGPPPLEKIVICIGSVLSVLVIISIIVVYKIRNHLK